MTTLDLNHNSNKSSLYLSAMLSDCHKDFKKLLGQLDIINFYMDDIQYTPSYDKSKCIFIHVKKDKAFSVIIEPLRKWKYHMDDYSLEKKTHMIVLTMEEHVDAFEAFHESKYSEMYSTKFIEQHYGAKTRKSIQNALMSNGVDKSIIKKEMNRRKVIYGVLSKDDEYRQKLSNALRAKTSSITGNPVYISNEAELASVIDPYKEIYRYGKKKELTLVAHTNDNGQVYQRMHEELEIV